MNGPELYDQDGYLIRMGVRGAIKYAGKFIRARHLHIIVNDDHWNGVQYIEAQADELKGLELGNPNPWIGRNSARGHIEILWSRKDSDSGDPIIEPARRILALHPDSHLAVVVNDPDDGTELRRLTFHGCRWDPPSMSSINQGHGALVVGNFKAEWYEDAP